MDSSCNRLEPGIIRGMFAACDYSLSDQSHFTYRLVTAKSIRHLYTKILKYVFDIIVIIPALKIQGFEY